MVNRQRLTTLSGSFKRICLPIPALLIIEYRAYWYALKWLDRITFMHKEHTVLDRIDYRDLRMLATLLETRSVTRTAERLGLSQPATSRALDKLRRQFGDRLVVRTSKGGALTPRGQALVSSVIRALSAIQNVFSAAHFDPASANGIIRIATTDYGAAVVVAPLSAHLSMAAPGLSTHIRQFGTDTFDRLADGYLDLALYADAEIPPDFRATDLFHETFSCLLRKNHPALEEGQNDEKSLLRRLAHYPRVAMLYPEGPFVLEEDMLSDLVGTERSITLATPYFFSAPAAISQSDMSLFVPSRVAALMSSAHDLHIFRLKMKTGFTYRLLWHERVDRDQQHLWLREVVVRAFQDSPRRAKVK